MQGYEEESDAWLLRRIGYTVGIPKNVCHPVRTVT